MSEQNLNQRVASIKGNNEQVDRLIDEYRPFIANVVQGHVGRFVEYGVDDELSIALMAFHEAIDNYDVAKGNFLSFASMTIKHRLIDYYRKEKRNSLPVVSIESEDTEGVAEDLSAGEAIKRFNDGEIATLRRLEIQELAKELSLWGISFADVAKSSPKQRGTKKSYLEAVKLLVNTPELLEIMRTKRYLPIEKIVKAIKIPRKTIERGRNYIVAAALILSGDYHYLKDYVHWG